MGGPVGKASGRTFYRMSTHLPDTCRSSLSVTSSHTLNMSIQSPSEALKSGLPMSVSATVRLIERRIQNCQIQLFFKVLLLARRVSAGDYAVAAPLAEGADHLAFPSSSLRTLAPYGQVETQRPQPQQSLLIT